MKNMIVEKRALMPIDLIMEKFDKLKAKLIADLNSELPAIYTYHTPAHTERVIAIAKSICEYENLSQDRTMQVLYAALFHDAGFLLSEQEHELHSAKLARKHLTEEGFPTAFITKVESLILATKLSYNACQHEECIICDADLEYLGTEEYFDISDQLRQEWANLGQFFTNSDWLALQINFLNGHKFQTAWAKKFRETGKQKNLLELQNRFSHSK